MIQEILPDLKLDCLVSVFSFPTSSFCVEFGLFQFVDPTISVHTGHLLPSGTGLSHMIAVCPPPQPSTPLLALCNPVPVGSHQQQKKILSLIRDMLRLGGATLQHLSQSWSWSWSWVKVSHQRGPPHLPPLPPRLHHVGPERRPTLFYYIYIYCFALNVREER